MIELQPVLDVAEEHARIQMPDRSKGQSVHVSALIRRLQNTVLKRGQYKSPEEQSPEERKYLALYASMGWAWEGLIRAHLANVWVHEGMGDMVQTGELERDGISGNPDGFRVSDSTVIELKASWKSSGRFYGQMDCPSPDFWPWLVQTKAYAYMLEVRDVEILAYFVNGNYKPIKPRMRRWHFQFSQGELESNWGMLMTAKGELQRGQSSK